MRIPRAPESFDRASGCSTRVQDPRAGRSTTNAAARIISPPRCVTLPYLLGRRFSEGLITRAGIQMKGIEKKGTGSIRGASSSRDVPIGLRGTSPVFDK